MSRKGVSAEEKRKRLEALFHESGDFYQLKEVEKLGTKKGIVSQAIKDVLQSLVDDGLVSTDRIGTSNYYWSFPATAALTHTRMRDLKRERDEELEKRKKLKETTDTLSSACQPSEEREALLHQWKQAQQENKALLLALSPYKNNDPVMIKAKASASLRAKEAANRWTENLWTLQSYCVRTFGIERSVLNEQFGLEDTLDTLP
ncbi:meiotic nuclear division protein 1 [Spinellus fusiger]|nr:meiotic nuclear division protein 1 [Spinellus fusiger]